MMTHRVLSDARRARKVVQSTSSIDFELILLRLDDFLVTIDPDEMGLSLEDIDLDVWVSEIEPTISELISFVNGFPRPNVSESALNPRFGSPLQERLEILIQNIQRLDNALDEVDRVPLSGFQADFLSTMEVANRDWLESELQNVTTNLEKIRESVSDLYFSCQMVLAVIEAWEALDDSEQDGVNDRSLDFVFSSESLNLFQSISWLTFLDGVMELAFATAGELSDARGVRLRRLETGSIFTVVAAIPEEVWSEIVGFIRRGFDRRGIKAANEGVETSNILNMLEGFTKISELTNAGRITFDQGEAIKMKLLKINDVPLPGKFQVMASGVEICTFDELDNAIGGRSFLKDVKRSLSETSSAPDLRTTTDVRPLAPGETR